MKVIDNIIIGGDIVSLFAMVLIFLKVGLLTPKCFSLIDAYITVTPIFLTKVSEFIKIFGKEEKIKSE